MAAAVDELQSMIKVQPVQAPPRHPLELELRCDVSSDRQAAPTSTTPPPCRTPTPSPTPASPPYEYDWTHVLWITPAAQDRVVIQELVTRPASRAKAPRPTPSMADDFSEGRLETFVGTPQKELPGTKDAYVSYLVTTKVGD
jgi:hypothetical protein